MARNVEVDKMMMFSCVYETIGPTLNALCVSSTSFWKKLMDGCHAWIW